MVHLAVAVASFLFLAAIVLWLLVTICSWLGILPLWLIDWLCDD
jgi:hypothetical protein